MHDDNDFLRKLLENPADDTVRLVYADWLDERADEESTAKAQFLRLTVRLLEPDQSAKAYIKLHRELQPLAAKLPTDWLAVVSRLNVERCAGKRTPPVRVAGGLRMNQFFNFVCDKRWDELTPTDDDAVRHCSQCKESVHYCDTIGAAREHAARGHCVAVDLGIIRRDNDLNALLFQMAMVGRPSAADLEEERKRNEVDEVSREREERKRNAN
jgi:uncharacterized protein (TIGR02996 family)